MVLLVTPGALEGVSREGPPAEGDDPAPVEPPPTALEPPDEEPESDPPDAVAPSDKPALPPAAPPLVAPPAELEPAAAAVPGAPAPEALRPVSDRPAAVPAPLLTVVPQAGIRSRAPSPATTAFLFTTASLCPPGWVFRPGRAEQRQAKRTKGSLCRRIPPKSDRQV